MEKDSTEYVHKMVQRAFEVCEQVHLQFGNRLERRLKTHCLTTSTLAQEDNTIQQKAFVQTAKNGEHFHRTEVYREREHSLGEYR